MAYLHYGSELRIRLDEAVMEHAMDEIASHATRGGWVTVADINGREWSFLVSAGIAIWINANE